MDFEAQLIEDFGHEKEEANAVLDENGTEVYPGATRQDLPSSGQAGSEIGVSPGVGGAAGGSDSEKRMRGAHGKTAYAIRVNVAKLIEEEGIDCIGFLTLTIGDQKE